MVDKRATTKTGSRDPTSKWAYSRLAICGQFLGDLKSGESCLEATLWVDEHTEFCKLGYCAHNVQANRWEWRAHRLDGNICLPEEGGVLDAKVPQPKPKNPSRADGIFGVCAPIPRGGRRQEGRRMQPFRYKGKVVGMATYERALNAEIERVRQLGLANRDNVADPTKKSTKGVWFDHVDDGVNPYEVSCSLAVAAFQSASSQTFSFCFYFFSRVSGRTGKTSCPPSST